MAILPRWPSVLTKNKQKENRRLCNSGNQWTGCACITFNRKYIHVCSSQRKSKNNCSTERAAKVFKRQTLSLFTTEHLFFLLERLKILSRKSSLRLLPSGVLGREIVWQAPPFEESNTSSQTRRYITQLREPLLISPGCFLSRPQSGNAGDKITPQ